MSSIPSDQPDARGEAARDLPDDHEWLITTAAESPEAQHRARVKRYSILMGLRIPMLALAAIAYGVTANGWVAMAILVLSIPIPWVAVLLANDRPARKVNEPRRYDRQRADLDKLAQLGPGAVLAVGPTAATSPDPDGADRPPR